MSLKKQVPGGKNTFSNYAAEPDNSGSLRWIIAGNLRAGAKVIFEDYSVIFSLRCLKFLQDTARNPYNMFEDTMTHFPGASLDILLELKRVKDEKMPPQTLVSPSRFFGILNGCRVLYGLGWLKTITCSCTGEVRSD